MVLHVARRRKVKERKAKAIEQVERKMNIQAS